MQKLVFNTTKKTAEITFQDGTRKRFEDVPTVFVGEGFYEIRQTDMIEDRRYPVYRLPIANTNMEIEK